MHEEEHVMVGIMFLFDVQLETMGNAIEILPPNATNEALGLVIGLNRLKLIAKLAKGINNQTLFEGEESVR